VDERRLVDGRLLTVSFHQLARSLSR